MEDILKNFDPIKIVYFFGPGLLFILFRSFSIKGRFPGLNKDDAGALIISSTLYWFIFIITFGTSSILYSNVSEIYHRIYNLFMLFGVPAIVGASTGFIEANDYIGRLVRRVGIRLPSPDTTAWQTFFRELRVDSFLIVTLDDESKVYGRWVAGSRGSAASTDGDNADLFIGQIGQLSDGAYIPDNPRRGIYIAASQIRYIEAN